MARTVPVRVRWLRRAQDDMAELLVYIATFERGDPDARFVSITQAVNDLRSAPESTRHWRILQGKTYRLLIVEKRFLVPYIYYPPAVNRRAGLISIRAVRHGLRRAPLRGVHEIPRMPMRDS